MDGGKGKGRKGDRGGMKRVEFLEMVMAGFFGAAVRGG